MKTLQIIEKKLIHKTTKVYDFSVEDAHHYILSTGIVSHNSMFPQREGGGGSGPKFAASTIVDLTMRQDKIDKDVVGNIIHCKLAKARKTRPKKTVDVKLGFDSGLDRYYGLLPLALKYEVFGKDTKYIIMPDGSKVFESRLAKDPEKYYTEEVLQQIDDACKREFLFGGGEIVYDDLEVEEGSADDITEEQLEESVEE